MTFSPWFALGLIAMATVAIGGASLALTTPHATSDAQTAPTYRSEVRNLDAWVQWASARSERDPHSWLSRESLAQAYRRRAQLTGTWLDYVHAEDALNDSFAAAPAGAGPFLARAQLNASLHRYAVVEADLVRASDEAVLDDRAAAAIAGLRGDIAFQSGNYALAMPLLERAVALSPSLVRLFALADARNQLDDRAAADQLLDRAGKAREGQDVFSRAWLSVQRGVIAVDRGDWEEADRKYTHAATIFPGWWQTEIRRADLRALNGEHALALASYTELADRVGKPEIMDAAARSCRALGQNAEAARWTQRARAIYDRLLTDAPEAAYGHALDHFLDLEQDAATSVALAERNHALRPGGEAAIRLARAYVQAGRLAEATTVIEAQLATPWRTPQLHTTAALVYAADGDAARSKAEQARARALNPKL